MEVFTTHGAFSWSELITTDPAAAADFYGPLFGWQIETMDMPAGPYRVVKLGDQAIGGIMSMPLGAPAMPPNWGCYVTVDQVDALVERVVDLGGTVIVAPMPVPGVGRFAVIQDPQGALLNVISYEAPTGGA